MTSKQAMEKLNAFIEKMQTAGLPEIAIRNFNYYYLQLLEGVTGLIPENEIEPVDSLPDAESLSDRHTGSGEKMLQRTVLLKLNGGLGTSMGLNRAKSLITVKDGLSFLDIIAQHALSSRVHLILMNSFATREASLAILEKYSGLTDGGLKSDFLQHKIPKIDQHTLLPAAIEDAPHLEWCPPGHGDIYAALVTSGLLSALLGAGYRYALISNSDNLGATLDASLLGYMVDNKIPFLMEVADRTESDKKGGHLARQLNGQLVLRESAQCPQQDLSAFEDISRHKYFNTNNLWVDLSVLHTTMLERENILKLPLIRNSKTADPRDEHSPPVYQLETAMGAAISVIDNAKAIRVPKKRFAPVKTTNDLLLVRSDLYTLSRQDYTLTSLATTHHTPVIELDQRYYKIIDDFESRFPKGAPSLWQCASLKVAGDILFEDNITIKGKIRLINHSSRQVIIPANSIIDHDMEWRD